MLIGYMRYRAVTSASQLPCSVMPCSRSGWLSVIYFGTGLPERVMTAGPEGMSRRIARRRCPGRLEDRSVSPFTLPLDPHRRGFEETWCRLSISDGRDRHHEFARRVSVQPVRLACRIRESADHRAGQCRSMPAWRRLADVAVRAGDLQRSMRKKSSRFWLLWKLAPARRPCAGR